MSPRTKKQNQERQEASKKRILEAALPLFAEQGFEKTSIRQIAQAAEISQGLMYNYFSSKDHLLQEIIRQGMVYAADAFTAIPLGAPPMEQLEALVRQIYVELVKQEAFWRVFYSLRNLPTFQAIIGQEIIDRSNDMRNFFHQLYVQAGSPNPEQQSWTLYAMVEGIIQQYLLFGERYPLQEVVDEAVRLHIKSHS